MGRGATWLYVFTVAYSARDIIYNISIVSNHQPARAGPGAAAQRALPLGAPALSPPFIPRRFRGLLPLDLRAHRRAFVASINDAQPETELVPRAS